MAERIKQGYEKYYDNIGNIGYGASGSIYKVREKKTYEIRAIKVINLDPIRKYYQDMYEEEEIENQLKLYVDGLIEKYNNMKICSENNNNSVKCYEYFNNEKYFAIVMELCDKDLSKLLLEKKKFNIEEISEIMKQLYYTFYIMKEKNI